MILPTTLLPSYYPPPPFLEVDHIIFELWNRHLELELAKNCSEIATIQHLEITAAVIEFWEEKLNEINKYELQKRRSNSSQYD